MGCEYPGIGDCFLGAVARSVNPRKMMIGTGGMTDIKHVGNRIR